jgi:dTDP-4-dehydrorhamnose 3,5-epimerase
MEEKVISKTSIDGLFVIERPTFLDERGFFHEIARVEDIKNEIGIEFKPVQWSHSFSKPDVIRAIHSENWNKIVYPMTGKLFVPIVDVRPDSKTFGKIEEFTFDNTKEDAPHQALFLSKGLGNSLCAFGDEAVHYVYLTDEYWDNSKARGIAWDDPDLNIKWPVENPIISDRDRKNPTLRDLYPEKFK